jgi:uncharacterized membrane protein YdjX (TVP38/TMEM64 family)
MSFSRYYRLAAVILFLAVLFTVFEATGLRQHFSLEFLRGRIEENMVTGLAVFVLLFCLGNLIQIPGWIFLAAAVLTLGKTWGGVATYIAGVTSCLSTYFIVGFIGGDALRKLNSTIAARIFEHLDRRPLQSVFLLRTIFQTVPALNYALALSAVRFRDYAMGTILGLPIPIAIYCIGFDFLETHVFKL